MRLTGTIPFNDMLVAANRLGDKDFSQWLFLPGMGFAERRVWWSNEPRPRPHEGIDFVCYRTTAGGVALLGDGAAVVAPFAGRVARIHEDFLGKTVWLRHDLRDGQGRVLHSALGHLAPRPGLETAAPLAAGEVVGAVAAVDQQRSALLAHLHLSLVWLAADFPAEALDWQAVHEQPRARLCDPLEWGIGSRSALPAAEMNSLSTRFQQLLNSRGRAGERTPCR